MSKELPKVSVVTITYGHEKYITETLDGVLMQQYQGPVEFIIANDNSPDATDEVVKKYFLENPAPSNFEIKYTKHETNKGMMPNFIWALEQATGEYIALCEGDDYWTDPLKLQKQIEFLQSNDEFVAHSHNVQIVGLQNRPFSIMPSRVFVFKDLLERRMFHTNSVTFRNNRSITRKLKLALNIFSSDKYLFLSLTQYGKINYSDDTMAVYNKNVGGISRNVEFKQLIKDLNIVSHFKSSLNNGDMYNLIKYTLYVSVIDSNKKLSVLEKLKILLLSIKNDFKYKKLSLKIYYSLIRN